MKSVVVGVAVVVLLAAFEAQAQRSGVITARFEAPKGFTRVEVDDGSFGAWLRQRTILPEGTPVRSFDGDVVKAPWNKGVVELELPQKDLQQCADTAIRLYADYHREAGTLASTSFHATSGDEMPWARYARGERAVADGNALTWHTGQPAATAATEGNVYRAWLDDVFMYAGSISLAKDTVAVDGNLRPGDLLVQPGSPGHVLVVMDVAEQRVSEGGPRRQQLLLGQGFMPAQSFHVIGWFAPDDDGAVTVPSWPRAFGKQCRRRFR